MQEFTIATWRAGEAPFVAYPTQLRVETALVADSIVRKPLPKPACPCSDAQIGQVGVQPASQLLTAFHASH